MNTDPLPLQRPSHSRRTLVIVVALVAVALVGFVYLPGGAWALSLVEWIREGGAAGVVVFAIAYIVATALLLPGSFLTLGAGFVYGPIVGTLLVSPISVTAATLAFLIARFVARDWVANKVSRDERFAAIDAAAEQNGFKIVLLLRLSPILPFNVLNYALGLTRTRVRDYVLASWLGMLPGTILYVYLGSLVTSASELLGDRPSAGPWEQALYWGGLAATLLVTILITRVAKRALKSTLGDAGSRRVNSEPAS